MTLTRMGRRMALVLGTAFAISAMAQAPAAPKVKFQTNLGNFTLELYPDKAPKTVENFLQYVKDKQYNGTVFHRVISGFMIQGGGFDANMKEKATRAPIANEANNGLKNDRGTIAMARTSNPDSATAQFFINTVDNGFLNYSAPTPQGWGYAVFGKVIAGMDTVDKIRVVQTGNIGMNQNVPLTPVIINAATLEK